MLTDTQQILATLSGYSIPDTFIPETNPAPTAPQSLSDMFGLYPEDLHDASAFNNYYDQTTNTWTTADTTIASPALRAAVAAQLAVIQAYDVALTAWEVNYSLQRDFQWRELLAAQIITSSSSVNVYGEAPAGTIDGVNTVFTTANAFVSDTVQVFLNGLLQNVATDYTLSGPQTITMLVAPSSGEIILVNYTKS